MPADKQGPQRLIARLSKVIKQVAEDPAADHIHQLRTNSRRVEALLSSPGSAVSSNEKLFKQLKRLRKRAGKVRDIDVQISALNSVQLEGQYEHKQRVLAALQRRRVKQAKKLVALVEESGDEVRKRVAKRKAKIFAGKTGADGSPKTDYYQAALESFRQAAEQHGIHKGATTDPEKLHEFRLAAKAARYTAELANGPQAKALVKELRRVQDVIGEWHDWQVLQETAADELGDVRASALVSILQNIVGAKFAAAVLSAAQVTEKLLERPSDSPRKKGPTSARPAAKTRDMAAGF